MVPIHAPIVGIFLVSNQIRNKIMIGLVDDKVATIPASAYLRAINKRLIPRAIPKKPLIIDWPTILYVSFVLVLKIS